MFLMLKTGDWGGVSLDVTFRKIDLLPRFTISEMTGVPLHMDIGFLMLTFNLTLYSKEMRRFVKKAREDGFEKIAKDLEAKCEELKRELKKEDAVED